MGNLLIIKDADFHQNAVGQVTVQEYEDITTRLIQGFISGNESVGFTLFNGAYNPTNTLIERYLVLMDNTTTFYPTNGKNVEFYLPQGLDYALKLRPWALATPYSIQSSNGLFTTGVAISAASDVFYEGGRWYAKSDIYQKLGVSESDYPLYGFTVGRYTYASNPLSLQQVYELGLKVRVSVD